MLIKNKLSYTMSQLVAVTSSNLNWNSFFHYRKSCYNISDCTEACFCTTWRSYKFVFKTNYAVFQWKSYKLLGS